MVVISSSSPICAQVHFCPCLLLQTKKPEGPTIHFSYPALWQDVDDGSKINQDSHNMFDLNMLMTVTVHPSANLKHHLLLTPQIIIQEMALFQGKAKANGNVEPDQNSS
jgi:hypothetical protein